ncbi:MAG: hypothetical protein LC753_18965 [Acidobacteria bacterium]|nr:hypothetical protein [Acidobacteriota bacterium]MCA1652246.1 hypothetical protein [Acidobacteriota bacterium]
MIPTLMHLRTQAGSALLITILLTTMLGMLAGAFALLARTETMTAGNLRRARAAVYAADALIQRVMPEFEGRSWNDVLSGAVVSSLTYGSAGDVRRFGAIQVILCCGGGSLTARLQASSDGNWARSGDRPVWRLYAWGSLEQIAGAAGSSLYVALWVSDDRAEADGNPLADSNGAIRLHAEALGPSGVRRAIAAVVARADAPGYWEPAAAADPAAAPAVDPRVRLVSWREVRQVR